MFRSILIGMTCVVFVNPVLADDDAAVKCSKIDDATERLFCYDSLFRPHLPPQSLVTSPSIEQPRDVDEPLKELPQEKEVPATNAIPPSFGEEQIKRNKPKARQNDQPKINQATTTIKNVYKRPMGEFAFEMEDGQIWHQQSVGYFKVKAGDTVVLIRHRGGGYSLRSPGGRSTRVRRIR